MHDYENGFYICKDKIIDLTFIENEILNDLIKNKDKKIIPYKQNATKTAISRLNKKLEGKIKIKNKRKFGYYIVYIGD